MPEIKNEVIRVSNENIFRGVLFSLLAVVAGVVAWVVLWRFGFIASLVAFLIAWLAVKLYTYGAGRISRKTAPIVVGVIILGVVLSFLAGIASDVAQGYAEGAEIGEMEALLSGDFWSLYFSDILFNGEVWAAYAVDLAISLVFAALGVYGTIRALFTDEASNESDKNSNETK